MRHHSASWPHIVIVGGGAGGLELAVRLGRTIGGKGAGRTRARVTLVDRTDTHLWKPRLHEVATGLLASAEEEASFVAQGVLHGFSFVLGQMVALDINARKLRLGPVPWPDTDRKTASTDMLLPERVLTYDMLVLAIGSRVNDFGTPGVAEYCYMLDNPDQANRLHRSFLSHAFQVRTGQLPRLNVGIVGAGATGVELAAELHEAVHHLGEYGDLLPPDRLGMTIIDMADRVLPAVDVSTSAFAREEIERRGIALRLGKRVEKVTADALHLADGQVVPAEIKVWASGIKGHDVVSGIAGLQVTHANRIRVDAALRALATDGQPRKDLFCLGDCADFTDPATGHPIAPTAQAAHQQASLLARSLRRVLRGQDPLPFRFRYKGTLVSLGGQQAVGDLPFPNGVTPANGSGIQIRGRGAKLIYVGLYRTHLAMLYGWPRTAALTLSSMLRRSAQPPIKLH